MTLRLALVSLVAGMGIGLPAWPAIEGWVGATQKWMNSRLADLDVRRGEEPLVVIHDLLTEEMERARASRFARRQGVVEPSVAPRVATIALPHPSFPRVLPAALETPAPEIAPAPAVVPEPLALPRLDDYLAGVIVGPPAPAAAPEFSPARPDEMARLAWDRFRETGSRLAQDFARGVREAEARESLDVAFAALEASDHLYFDDAFELKADVAPAAAEPAPVVVEAVEEPTPLPGFEAMEQAAELYFAGPIADEEAPAPEAVAETGTASGPATAAVADAPALASLPDDVFAPEEVAVPVQVAKADEAPAPAGVNRAVRLTREALGAWVNVLTGPALVTASHDSVTR